MDARPRLRWLVAMAGIVCATGAAAEEPTAVLDLPHQGFLAGRLLDERADAADRPVIRWQSPDFSEPFEFPSAAVRGIRFPAADVAAPAASGMWRLELAGGDEFVCNLVGLDVERLQVTIGPAAAAMAVRRSAVVAMRRETPMDDATSLGRLADWRQLPPESWHEEGGRFVTAGRRATLVRNVAAPDRCRYDITLSWDAPPAIEIGFDHDTKDHAAAAYRLVVGDTGVVAVRDELGVGDGARADLQSCGGLPADRLDVSVFIDRAAGRMAVAMPGGVAPVADMTLLPGAERAAAGLRIQVTKGTVAIDELRITPWRDGLPAAGAGGAGGVWLRGGATVMAVVERLDAGTGSILFKPADVAGTVPKSVSLDDVERIVFAARQPTAKPTDAAAAAVSDARIEVTDRLGSRLSGGFCGVREGVLRVDHPAFEGPLSLPVAALATLTNRERDGDPAAPAGRLGRITTPQGSHQGCLVPANGGAAPGGLLWQPWGSLTGSPLAVPTPGGRPQATIDYAERPRPPEGKPPANAVGGIGCHLAIGDGMPLIIGVVGDSAAAQAGVVAGEQVLAIAPRGDGRFVETAGLPLEDVQHLARGRVGTPVQLRLRKVGDEGSRELRLNRRPMSLTARSPQALQAALEAHDRLVPPVPVAAAGGESTAVLVLRTGETVSCHVDSVGDAGVIVRLPGSDPVTVPHPMVQAVELVPAVGRPLTSEKFRGLTTLPRLQEHQPPTHVLRSLTGDYLRGRLLAVTDTTVQLAIEAEPRGKPLTIPRDQVARLIWLHPHDGGGLTEEHAAADTGWPVETVDRDGGRLRMAATAIDGNMLLGRNPTLGDCRVDLTHTDRLFIGAAIDAEAATRPVPYGQWRLRPAPTPRNLPPRSRGDASPVRRRPAAADEGGGAAKNADQDRASPRNP